MKVELVNGDELKKVKEIKSGTVVQYGNDTEIYGYGIVLKDIDCDNPIIYNLEDNCYYKDYEKYYIWHEFDMNNVKLVIE